MRKQLLFPAAGIGAAYALNRFVLSPASSGLLHTFLAWYANDALAGALMLLILNALLAHAGRAPITGIFPVTAFSLGCGCFWEFVTPLYLPRSVSDPWDLLACWCGAMAVVLIQRLARSACKTT